MKNMRLAVWKYEGPKDTIVGVVTNPGFVYEYFIF